MKVTKSLALVAAILVAGLQVTTATAMPALHVDADSTAKSLPSVESVRIVCGRFRCYRTFGYRRYYGYGYRPYRYYGYPRLGFGFY